MRGRTGRLTVTLYVISVSGGRMAARQSLCISGYQIVIVGLSINLSIHPSPGYALIPSNTQNSFLQYYFVSTLTNSSDLQLKMLSLTLSGLSAVLSNTLLLTDLWQFDSCQFLEIRSGLHFCLRSIGAYIETVNRSIGCDGKPHVILL